MWRKTILGLFVAVLAVPVAVVNYAAALTVSPVVVEYDVQPGQTIVWTIKLRNEGDTRQTYFAQVQDFVAGDEAGTPQFIGESSDRSLVDLTSFNVDQVALDAGESKLVEYRVRIPEDAAPGGYTAGLLFSTQDPAVGEGVGAVAMTGTLVLVRVAGDIVERASVESFTVEPESATHLPVNFGVDIRNSGTVHVKPRGVIRITNMFGGTSAVIPVNETGGNVLPESDRMYTAKWQKTELPENASELAKEWKNFAFGPYTATLVLNYGENDQVVSAETSFWVMPWMLVVLFIILLVVLALLVMQYNKWIVARAMGGKKK